MDETKIEDALTAWVAAATGLPASDPGAKIVWGDQGSPRPATPWISMNWHISESVGHAGMKYTRDQSSNGHDGHELVATSTVLERDRISIQCFAAEATGPNSARAILNRIVVSRKLPAIAAALRAAGIGVLRFGPITNVGAVVNVTQREPRAQLEVFLALVNQATAPDTTIDTVNAGVKVHDETGADVPSLDFTATA